MGSSASIGCENVDRRFKDTESLVAVQKFTELAYDVSPKAETMKIILENPHSRDAFAQFLSSDKNGNGARFLLTANDERKNFATENLVFDYQLPNVETEAGPTTIADNVSQLLGGDREVSNDDISSLLLGAKTETVALLALDALPRFINSQYFKDWRADESERAMAIISNASDVNVTIPEILAADPTVIDTPIVATEASFVKGGTKIDVIEGASLKPVTEEVIVEAVAVDGPADEDIVEKAMKNVDYLEIDRLLRSGSWLFTFVAAVENLPICITLSTARKDRIGFPLIYVNRYFETTSGYCRTDIMGANCKFLQRDGSGMIRSETDSVERLSNALKNAEPIKVAITNFRRDGTPFKNLLAIKPVFDAKGEYEYVIGVQFDISSQRSSSYALRLVDALVKLLPSVVVF